MSDDLLKAQVNALIRDEIQDVINDYVDDKDKVTTQRVLVGLLRKKIMKMN